jgi:hypothetical protein
VHTGIGGGLLFVGPIKYQAKSHKLQNENDHGNDDMKKKKKKLMMIDDDDDDDDNGR